MNPINPLPAVVAALLAMATALLIGRRTALAPSSGRYAAIDGLRGWLAFCVFVHHSCIWYFYLQSGKWALPPSRLYTNLGQDSVALFFMITGLLFFSKMIDGRARPIDWARLFVSRFLRLVPLYLCAMLALFGVVAILSRGRLQVPGPSLFGQSLRWLTFTVAGNPDVNGVVGTRLIMAGVVRTLPYEWKFYFCLPLLALVAGVRAPVRYLAMALLAGLYLQTWKFDINYLSFVGGMAAAVLVRAEGFRHWAVRWPSAVVACLCLLAAAAFFDDGSTWTPIALLSVFFIIVAAGNSLFGVLALRACRLLGDWSYGIYLLHGLLLFVMFELLIGQPAARGLGPLLHWVAVMVLAPVVVLVAALSHRYVEHPAMQRTQALTTWLRARWAAVPLWR